MKKFERIRYAIEKECSRASLVEWCELWGFTINEFRAYLSTADENAPENLKEEE